jgi:DeoR family transcriptional regulator of aga operon
VYALSVEAATKTTRVPGERGEAILRLLRQSGAVSIEQICSGLGISLATARRDLKRLQASGVVRRTRGGAMQPEPLLYQPFLHDSTFQEQLERHAGEKRRIALAAAEQVRDGETVALTAGTTTTEVVRCLRSRQNLKIVTNAVNIAMELGRQKGWNVHLTGGHLRGEWFSLAGPDALRMLSSLFVDVAFIGVNGIDPGQGPTCFNQDEAAVNAAMVERAKRRIVVADHSKLVVIATHRICPLETIHLLITGSEAPEEAAAEYTRQGLEVRRV